MAKKELDYAKLTLPTKTAVVKQADAETAVEKAVETIHPKTPSVSAPVAAKNTPPKQQMMAAVEPQQQRRVSLDLPGELYTYVKINSFTRRVTMRDYMVQLIKEEMERKRG